jgi:hypothetical protein
MNEEDLNPKKRGRKKDTNFPKYLTCTKTGKQVFINVTQLRKHLEKIGKTFEEYAKTYVAKSRSPNVPMPVENDETTIINPPISEDIGKEIEYIKEQVKIAKEIDKEHAKTHRKELIKELWQKIAQNPPEYYQEKFKLRPQQT